MACVSMLGVILLTLLASSDAGVSFVRWGRTKCPDNTVALYKGYMTGPYSQTGGSGGNYLCVDESPQLDKGVPGRQGNGALIFGVEFDIVDHFKNAFSSENIPGGKIWENDMPCVVCYVQGSYDKIMLPGRHDCHNSGYDLQYNGYLVAEIHSGRGRTEFTCLDGAPEGRMGGSNNNDEGIIYPVEIGCGSLPCNPFVEGMEMPCAVCTY